MTVIEGGGGVKSVDNDCYRRGGGGRRNRVTMTVMGRGEEK